jgi:DNA-binding Lrp family transcriptional regulator
MNLETRLSRLIEVVQQDLPLVNRPFEEIGRQCDLSEDEVLRGLRELVSSNIIRELSALLNGRRLGFRSTLVAVKVPEGEVGSVASKINQHSGVSHNYLREHAYNVWFTIAAEQGQPLNEVVERLLDSDSGVYEHLLLPAVRTFKLRVNLRVSGARSRSKSRRKDSVESVRPANRSIDVDLDHADRELLAKIECPIPVESRPWQRIAESLGRDESWALRSIQRYKEIGVVRRISAVLRHRNVGYNANGMCCYAVPSDRIIESGQKTASHDFVSHCYQRDANGEWPYPLFAMIHAHTTDECMELAKQIADEISVSDYQVLFSTRELKKERVKYFGGEVK